MQRAAGWDWRKRGTRGAGGTTVAAVGMAMACAAVMARSIGAMGTAAAGMVVSVASRRPVHAPDDDVNCGGVATAYQLCNMRTYQEWMWLQDQLRGWKLLHQRWEGPTVYCHHVGVLDWAIDSLLGREGGDGSRYSAVYGFRNL